LRAGYWARWTRAFGGVRDGGRGALEGGRRTAEAAAQGDVDEALLEAGGTVGDALGRVDAPRVAVDPQTWALEQLLSLALPDAPAFRDAALTRAGANLLRALPKQKDRLAHDYLALGKDLGGDLAIGERSIGALRLLAGDEKLKADIARRYGPEARARVERFLGSVATDAELGLRSHEVGESALELCAGVLRELALDDAGKGPNPLLVAFVREKLLDRAGPVLILRAPGSGDPVSEGQVYVSRRR